MSDTLQTAVGIYGLVGLAWFGLWLSLGTIGSVANSSFKTSLFFTGFVANLLFLTSVAASALTIAGTL